MMSKKFVTVSVFCIVASACSGGTKEECARWILEKSDILNTPELYDHWLKACQDAGGAKNIESAILSMPKEKPKEDVCVVFDSGQPEVVECEGQNKK